MPSDPELDNFKRPISLTNSPAAWASDRLARQGGRPNVDTGGEFSG